MTKLSPMAGTARLSVAPLRFQIYRSGRSNYFLPLHRQYIRKTHFELGKHERFSNEIVKAEFLTTLPAESRGTSGLRQESEYFCRQDVLLEMQPA